MREIINFSLLLTFIVLYRSRQIGTSISAAQSFFQLFDRTPTIDNTSTKGRELVRDHLKNNHFLLVIYGHHEYNTIYIV